MLAGIGSAEPPQENKKYRALLPQLKQADLMTIKDFGIKFGSRCSVGER